MKGVTITQKDLAKVLGISTHTPVKGVTTSFGEYPEIPRNFNSHAREGRDFRHFVIAHIIVISTHTPVKGVTVCLALHSSHLVNFNSHAREGRDNC